MARYDGEFTPAGEVSLDLHELIEALRHAHRDGTVPLEHHRHAIACYLSRGEGWKDALGTLGGTFAGDAAKSALKGQKEE